MSDEKNRIEIEAIFNAQTKALEAAMQRVTDETKKIHDSMRKMVEDTAAAKAAEQMQRDFEKAARESEKAVSEMARDMQRDMEQEAKAAAKAADEMARAHEKAAAEAVKAAEKAADAIRKQNEEAADAAKKRADHMRKTWGAVGDDVKDAFRKINDYADRILLTTSGSVAAAIGAIGLAANKAAEDIDSLSEQSQLAGMDFEEYQSAVKYAGTSGVDKETLDTSVKFLNRNLQIAKESLEKSEAEKQKAAEESAAKMVQIAQDEADEIAKIKAEAAKDASRRFDDFNQSQLEKAMSQAPTKTASGARTRAEFEADRAKAAEENRKRELAAEMDLRKFRVEAGRSQEDVLERIAAARAKYAEKRKAEQGGAGKSAADENPETKDALDAIQKLGLDPDKLLKMKSFDRLTAISTAIGKIDNVEEQTLVTAKIFGKGGDRMRLVDGAGLSSAPAQFRTAGGIYTEDEQKKYDGLMDKWKSAKDSVLVNFSRSTAPVLDRMVVIVEEINKWLEKNAALVRGRLTEAIENILSQVEDGLPNIGDKVLEYSDGFLQFSKDVRPVLKEVVAFFQDIGWLFEEASKHWRLILGLSVGAKVLSVLAPFANAAWNLSAALKASWEWYAKLAGAKALAGAVGEAAPGAAGGVVSSVASIGPAILAYLTTGVSVASIGAIAATVLSGAAIGAVLGDLYRRFMPDWAPGSKAASAAKDKVQAVGNSDLTRMLENDKTLTALQLLRNKDPEKFAKMTKGKGMVSDLFGEGGATLANRLKNNSALRSKFDQQRDMVSMAYWNDASSGMQDAIDMAGRIIGKRQQDAGFVTPVSFDFLAANNGTGAGLGAYTPTLPVSMLPGGAVRGGTATDSLDSAAGTLNGAAQTLQGVLDGFWNRLQSVPGLIDQRASGAVAQEQLATAGGV